MRSDSEERPGFGRRRFQVLVDAEDSVFWKIADTETF